jgi:protein TonB
MRGVSPKFAIVIGVLLMHLGAWWALQAGLLRPASQVRASSEIQVNLIDHKPPEPLAEVDRPKTVTPAVRPAALQQNEHSPKLIANDAQARETTLTTMTTTLKEASAAPVTEGSQTPFAPQAAAVKALELPSSDAQYLSNPRPAYPVLSKRLGEQGRVVIRALIGVDGIATQAVVRQSSGFERLDQASLATAQSWRYVPGKRAGVPEPMWFDVPFNWVLQ